MLTKKEIYNLRRKAKKALFAIHKAREASRELMLDTKLAFPDAKNHDDMQRSYASCYAVDETVGAALSSSMAAVSHLEVALDKEARALDYADATDL